MATNSIGINIKQIPQINAVRSGDFLLVETTDGTSIIDFGKIIIPLTQTDFSDTIDSIVSITAALSTQYSSLSSSIYSNVSSAMIQPVGTFKNIAALTGGQTFAGQGIDLPFNFIEVNTISTQQSVEDFSAINVCTDLTLSKTASAFILPAGTYKTFIDATITSIDYLTPSWAQLYLYQKTPPSQVLIHGSSFTATTSGQQNHLTVNGIFYLCRDAEISLKASTFGTFKLGGVALNALYPLVSSSSLSGSMIASLQTSACNISMYIERISASADPTVNKLSTAL